MGRSKPAPKRRRVENDQEQKQAIAALMSMPVDAVEEAAALATRTSLTSWPNLRCSSDGDPSAFQGLGHAIVEKQHFEDLFKLHRAITSKVSSWASWSGSPSDPRRRAFGFLPDTLGYDPSVRSRLDVSAPGQSEEKAQDERPRNERAFVTLNRHDLPEGLDSALDTVCRQLRPFVPSHIQPLLHRRYLIAAQPNLHSGRALLPAHVDHPVKDGFGVIIVTVAIEGSAQIFFTHKPKQGGDEQGGKLSVKAGSVYMLSGSVRNQCVHGVLADEDCPNRESLNLRFGLHDYAHQVSVDGESDNNSNKELLVPASEVLVHWGEDGPST